MVRIDDPIVVGDTLYLRTSDDHKVVRLPSAPDLIRPVDGTPAAALELFRSNSDDDPELGPATKGGVISLALDLGALDAERAARETELPSDLSAAIFDAPMAGGTLRLFLGDTRMAEAQIPSGRRPVIAVGLVVDATLATITRTAIDDGQAGPFAVAVEGSIAVERAGPATHVQIDFDRVAERMPGDDTLTAVAAAAAIDELVDSGVVRRELVAMVPGADLDILDRAVVANAIFEPVPGSASSFIPGVVLDGYTPSGMIRRRAGRGLVDLQLDGPALALPWFGSSLLDLTGALIRFSELPESPIDALVIHPRFALPPGIEAIALEVEMHGSRRTARLMPDQGPVTFRFLRPSKAKFEYRWRTGQVTESETTWGTWLGGGSGILVVASELLPAAPGDAS